MTEAQVLHNTALHLRKFADEAELPGYAEMLSKAADDLETRATELRTHSELEIVLKERRI